MMSSARQSSLVCFKLSKVDQQPPRTLTPGAGRHDTVNVNVKFTNGGKANDAEGTLSILVYTSVTLLANSSG